MRQKLALLCLGMILASAIPAHAEHRLLVTDVLDVGQFEAEADFAYVYSSNDVISRIGVGSTTTDGNIKVSPLTGTETRSTFSSLYSLGAGLGYGFQVNASIPYKFADRVVNVLGGVEHRDGFGDFSAGLKYRIFKSEKLPLAVAAGLDSKFNTAGRAGTESRIADSRFYDPASVEISPYLAASTAIGNDIKPYASYRATLRNNGNNDSHAVSVGAQYEMNPFITLSPSLSVTLHTDSDMLHSYQSYDLGLEAYLQVAKNLYLLPRVSYGISNPVSARGSSWMQLEYGKLKSEESVTAGAGVYYFFK